MTIDNIVYIDSPIYLEAHYQDGEKLFITLYNGTGLLLYDVSAYTFLKLYKNPTHKNILEIVNTHLKRFVF